MSCFSSKVNWKTVRITFRINLHSQLMFEYDFSATPKSDNASRATVSTISMRLFRLDPFDWINSQWTRVHHAQCIWLVTFFLIVSYFWWATQHIYTHSHHMFRFLFSVNDFTNADRNCGWNECVGVGAFYSLVLRNVWRTTVRRVAAHTNDYYVYYFNRSTHEIFVLVKSYNWL